MNDFAQFVGFFTAHMVWQLECGENVIPVIATQNAGERWFDRIVDDTSYERAVAVAKERIQVLRRNSDYVFLAYDGFLTLNDTRSESLIIDAAETTEPDELSICLAIPYRSARSKEGLAIHPLIVMKTTLSDRSTFFANFYEGAYSHTEGIKFWNMHLVGNLG